MEKDEVKEGAQFWDAAGDLWSVLPDTNHWRAGCAGHGINTRRARDGATAVHFRNPSGNPRDRIENIDRPDTLAACTRAPKAGDAISVSGTRYEVSIGGVRLCSPSYRIHGTIKAPEPIEILRNAIDAFDARDGAGPELAAASVVVEAVDAYIASLGRTVHVDTRARVLTALEAFDDRDGDEEFTTAAALEEAIQALTH